MRGIPTLRQMVVTNLPVGSEGSYVRFSVRVFNREGYVDSLAYVSILYAAVPSQPPSVPVLVEEESNSTVLTVTYDELVPADSGNSEIQAYSLEVDEGH